MRIAVVSDVHGNLTALDAVVADIKKQGVDLVVQGGDLVGGSRNAEVIDFVRERGWPGVYGNADEMLWMPEQVARKVPGPQFERMRNVVVTETIPFLREAVRRANGDLRGPVLRFAAPGPGDRVGRLCETRAVASGTLSNQISATGYYLGLS